MKKKNSINRRDFIGKAAATAATISIVPRHVLGGPGYVPPSDKTTLAHIGCGTQGLREMPALLKNPHLQIVAVCDPNKFSTDYLDWSPHGIRNSIRMTLGDRKWGENIKGIPGGRDVAKEYIDRYYGKQRPTALLKGCSSYEDFRELFAKENDIDVVKIMTPDHLHASIGIMAMKKGIHVVTHKPIANRLREGRLTINTARETGVATHLLAWDDKPEYELINEWIKDGVIGNLREIHNWSFRPVWPQWTSNPSDNPPIPEGFNWDLWLGPVPDRPYHPNYTHNVFRGWYDFGAGSFADMGHYSLFPLFVTLGIDTPPVSAKAYGTTTRTAINGVCRPVNNKVAFPYSALIKLKFPEQKTLPAFDLYWYDGGMKPFAPEELEIDGRDVAAEGLMLVGDKGKILAGFEGANPQIIPEAKMKAYQGNKTITREKPKSGSRVNDWLDPIRNNEQPKGNFIRAETITETINLGNIALRVGQKIEYDSENMKITNNEDANKYLTREYREGWEL